MSGISKVSPSDLALASCPVTPAGKPNPGAGVVGAGGAATTASVGSGVWSSLEGEVTGAADRA